MGRFASSHRKHVLWAIFAAVFVTVAGVALSLLGTGPGAGVIARPSISVLTGGGDTTWETIRGNLLKGVTITNMEVRRVSFLPEEAVLRVGELHLKASSADVFSWQMCFLNARILLPDADPLVADGRLEEGRWVVNIHTRTLAIRRILEFFPGLAHVSRVSGDLEAVELSIDAFEEEIRLAGTLRVKSGRYGDNLLEDADLHIDLILAPGASRWSLRGKVVILSGDLVTLHARTRLARSQITIGQDPLDPELDINGRARVGKTSVDIKVTGTRRDPVLSLTSDPPRSREELLLLLTTGKAWGGVDGALDTGKMTPQMSADLVDYFLFGGAGRRLGRVVGLDRISVNMDPQSQGISLRKDVTGALGIDYGLERELKEDQTVRYRHRLSGEYDLTDRLTIGLQKELLPGSQAAGPDETGIGRPDDRFYWRYRQAF
ncbi:MAG: hypothetical protein GX606_01600 [Elusimicrobia bacterium]|nr:hypothetical protein [Elusimicrobiota bacterium]